MVAYKWLLRGPIGLRRRFNKQKAARLKGNEIHHGVLDHIEWNISEIAWLLGPIPCHPFEICPGEPVYLMEHKLAIFFFFSCHTWNVFQEWNKFDKVVFMDSMRKWFHCYVGEVHIKIILWLHVIAICCFEDNWADVSAKKGYELSKRITCVIHGIAYWRIWEAKLSGERESWSRRPIVILLWEG